MNLNPTNCRMTKSPGIKTKEKIHQEAIRQFSEFGIQNITSRHIAKGIGISYGNLNYHFKTKEDLIWDIYRRMREEMDATYIEKGEEMSALEHYHKLLLQLEDFQYKYQFFNLDVLEICRCYPSVNESIQNTLKERKKISLSILSSIIEEGFMNPIPQETLERIEHINRMIVSFWLTQREVLASYEFQANGDMIKSIYTILNPLFTDKGKEELQRVIDQHGYKLS